MLKIYVPPICNIREIRIYKICEIRIYKIDELRSQITEHLTKCLTEYLTDCFTYYFYGFLHGLFHLRILYVYTCVAGFLYDSDMLAALCPWMIVPAVARKSSIYCSDCSCKTGNVKYADGK